MNTTKIELNKLQGENAITLKRRKAIYLPTYAGVYGETVDSTSSCLVFSFMENIAKLGFTLSESAFTKLCMVSENVLTEFLPMVIEEIKVIAGADVVYEPMYPGFPDQVRDMDSTQLYLNSMIHYISGGVLFPSTDEEFVEMDAVPLAYDELKKLDLMDDEKDLTKIFINLMSAKTSISEDDREDLTFYFESEYEPGTMFPEIPMKENIAFITKLYMNTVKHCNGNDLKNWYKTATDVLRLYAEMSDGDVSLATPTKFINLKRRDRKLLMDLLNNISYLDEDFARYSEYWKRAGERIHPNSFSDKKYAKVQLAFFKIRNKVKVRNWRGEVDTLLQNKDWEKATDKLAERPGEFARNLDYLLRNTSEPIKVVETFMQNKDKISTPVLLQVMKHFEVRTENEECRVFFPKGNVAKAYTISNTLSPIDDKYCLAIAKFARNEIMYRLGQNSFLGNVYVDESVKGFLVPFSQRSANASTRPCVRGSRLPFKKSTKYIRTFIWWTNREDGERVDVDSSISFFDENMKRTNIVSYYNLKDDGVKAYHSGDIVNGGEFGGSGLAEFVDIDVDSVVRSGSRYAVFEMHIFTGAGSFKEFPCRGGYMELPENEKPIKSGIYKGMSNQTEIRKIFDASRVEMKMDIETDGRECIPVIIDCVTREVIWTDMGIGINGIHPFINNAETTLSTSSAYLYSIINCNKPSLYDLIMMNVEARGVLVDEKEKADTVFSLNEGITPFDLDRFMSEFM